MAKKAVAMLEVDTPVSDAIDMMREGKITTEAYLEWDADRIKRLAPKSNGRTSDGTCDITKAEFEANAKPVTLTIDGHPLTMEPRTFTKGSFGWYVSGKVPVKVGNKVVKVQAGINLVVANSKNAK